MSEFLKWTCPKCGGHRIELVQVNAFIGTQIELYRDMEDTEYYDQEIYDADPDGYRCWDCGYRLPVQVTGDDAELRKYLEDLPENKEDQNG